MLRNRILGAALAVLGFCPAFADPTGTYTAIVGLPEEGQALRGSVAVTRLDETYRVVWTFDRTVITGIALGGAFNRGDLVVGPAHVDDLMLVIGYRDGDGYGSATLIKQFDGSYQGYRVSNRSGKALPERWEPAR